MIINCVLGCIHQQGGKCKLREVKENNTLIGIENSWCPYFDESAMVLRSLK